MSGPLSLMAVLMLALVSWSEAHKIGIGQCSKKTGMESFDREKFYGRWYINRIYSAINTCMTLDFEAKPDAPNEIKVSQGRELVPLDALSIKHTTNYVGTAQVGETKASEMLIKWPVSGLLGNMHYTVIDTDYTNYALTYECQSFWYFGNQYSASILSRNHSLEPTLLNEILGKATAAGIDVSALKVVSRDTCTKPGEGININTDPAAWDFNVLGLISDEKLVNITTEEELIQELGQNNPKGGIVQL